MFIENVCTDYLSFVLFTKVHLFNLCRPDFSCNQLFIFYIRAFRFYMEILHFAKYIVTIVCRKR